MESINADATDAPPSPVRRTLIEFVSADPTGLLTLHQARNGVVGDSVANLLLFAKYASETAREFYVNDGASALRVIARSLWSAVSGNEFGTGKAATDPDNASPLPTALLAAWRNSPQSAHYARVPFEEAAPFLQALIAQFWQTEHQETLADLGVRFDQFFKESELHAVSQAAGGGVAPVGQMLADLQAAHLASPEFGALWLRSSRIREGERDYVLRRADGSVTYLASDLAYHQNKLARGFDRLVDVWNADHAAYVGRTRAGLSALGFAPDALDVVLCGTVRLVKEGTEVKESGSGSLRELIDELGRDAVRFALLYGVESEPLVLDADRARLHDARNPFFVLQTAWATAAKAGGAEGDNGRLREQIAAFPNAVQTAADTLSPYAIARYAVDLSQTWNGLDAGEQAMGGAAVKETLRSALGILGVTLS